MSELLWRFQSEKNSFVLCFLFLLFIDFIRWRLAVEQREEKNTQKSRQKTFCNILVCVSSRRLLTFSRIDFHLQESQLFDCLTNPSQHQDRVKSLSMKRMKPKFFDIFFYCSGYISPHWCCLEMVTNEKISQIHKSAPARTCSRLREEKKVRRSDSLHEWGIWAEFFCVWLNKRRRTSLNEVEVSRAMWGVYDSVIVTHRVMCNQ